MSSALLGGVQSKIDWSAVYASWSRHIALCRGAGVRGEVDDRGGANVRSLSPCVVDRRVYVIKRTRFHPMTGTVDRLRDRTSAPGTSAPGNHHRRRLPLVRMKV